MKIHRYFFWIEDNFIEIYKNGNLEKYEGEEKLYIDNFEDNLQENEGILYYYNPTKNEKIKQLVKYDE